MSEPAVLYQRDDAVGVITLNRPDNRNSMTPEVLDAFAAASEQARQDSGALCVVVTGRGHCFSAGADFKSQLQRHDDARPLQPHERSYAMYAPFLSLLDIEVPIIAAMNGHAVGGGFGLSLVCDVRIANRASKYGANFARLGISAGMAISYLLPRLIGVSKAAELLFTGQLVLGDEAERIGLASAAVDVDEVLPRAMTMARRIASNGPLAVRFTKQTLYRGLGWDVRDAALREAYAQAITVTSDDAREGISALLEKRDPTFTGR